MPTAKKKNHRARTRAKRKHSLREELNNEPDAPERLRTQLDVGVQAKARADRVLDEIMDRPATLKMLRQFAELTQIDLAAAAGVAQPEVSAMEQRSDALLSTLRRFVEATGGELVLVVRYPDTAPAVLVVDN